MKKFKYLIYLINIKLILLDICLLIFIILTLCFSFLNKTNGETQKSESQNKISLSSMKELSDKKIRGVPFLNFKIPTNLYNDLEINFLSKKTKEEQKMVFDNVENFMKNFVKERINEKILEINNLLTKTDYDIAFIEPNNVREYNPRYKPIAMDFTIEGKNKATGQITQKLTVDVSIYGNNYN